MASFWSFFLVILMVCFCSTTTLATQKLQQQNVQQFSTISAAPALLPGPEPPLPSPTSPILSPDIEPLLPTTPQAPSPSESSSSLIPTIPSSPSPPNPDSILAPGPAGMVISPSGPLPESSTVALSSSSPAVLLVASLSVLWILMQLPAAGM